MTRWQDILTIAARNLMQRKARTALNLVGVSVGCMVLIMTAAAVTGVKDTIQVLFDSSESARQIGLLPRYWGSDDPPEDAVVVEGAMSDERRERIRERLIEQWREVHYQNHDWKLTADEVRSIEQLPHIQSVVPYVYIDSTVKLAGDSADAFISGVSAFDVNSSLIEQRLVAGELPGEQDSDASLISEFLAYQLGYRSDEALQQLLGQTLEVNYQRTGSKRANVYNLLTGKYRRLSVEDFAQQSEFLAAFSKLLDEIDATSLTENQKALIRKLLADRASEDYQTSTPAETQTFRTRITGIIRSSPSDSLDQLFRGHWMVGHGEILLPHRRASEIYRNASGDGAFYGAIVTVDSTRYLKESVELLEARGGETMSGLHILETMRERIGQIGWAMFGFAGIILITSAVGISNTLLASVLERTPEIGIMKSVGARDSTVLSVMVCEGAILGILGALLAIAFGYVFAIGGNWMLAQYVVNRFETEITTTLFQFSVLPVLYVTGVCVLICVIASIAPAWRAASLDPVVAMRQK